MITTKVFGKTKDGREVLAFTLVDGERSVTILNYGGAVQSLVVPDKNGVPTDVVLGYDTVAAYEENSGYLGALIGRFGNRIGEGKLTVDGKHYDLYINDRGNHLHGGKVGFDKKIWAHAIVGDVLAFSIISPDGEENYPGTLKVTVAYTFRNGKLKIRYRAVTDKTTVINLTNHAYFNLNGAGTGSILGHTMQIDCDRIVPTNPTMIPVGGYRPVKGTAFDFNEPKTIGRDIEADDVDLKQGNGYDHGFVLRNQPGEFIKFAVAEGDKSGIRMTCFTDMGTVQFYTGNGLHQAGKGGYYAKRDAFCLETGFIPNNVNVPEYAERGSSYLHPGETFESTTVYQFEA